MSRVDDLIAELCPDGVRFLPLGELVSIKNGSDHKHLEDGDIPVYGSGGIMRHVNVAAADGPSVLIPRKGSLGNIFFVTGPFWVVDTIFRTEIESKFLDAKFLYYQLLTMRLGEMNQAGGVPSQTQSALYKLRIPVPPFEVQREIVRILDAFTGLEEELENELEARRQQYEHYKERLLSPGRDAEYLTLADVGRVSMCKRVFKAETSPAGDVPFYKIGTFGGQADAFISNDLYENYRQHYSFPKIGDVLISAAGTIGRTVVYDGSPAYFQDSNIVWIDNDESIVLNGYLRYWYSVIRWATDGGTIRRLYNNNIRRAVIAVPPLAKQEEIITALDQFEALVSDYTVGLPAEIDARRKQYEYYRDKLLKFEEARL